MPGRIVVLVSGSGTNFEALADECARGEVPGEVVAVISDRYCPALEKARSRGFDDRLVPFADYKSREEWSEALRGIVASYEPDLVVSAGFMRIVSPVFVDAFAGRLINLHPALLPAFPGAHAVGEALEAGVTETGSTVHFVDHLVDHGPTILQERVPVLPGDTEDSLHERIKALEHSLLPRACRLLLEGKVRLEGDRVRIDSDD